MVAGQTSFTDWNAYFSDKLLLRPYSMPLALSDITSFLLGATYCRKYREVVDAFFAILVRDGFTTVSGAPMSIDTIRGTMRAPAVMEIFSTETLDRLCSLVISLCPQNSEGPEAKMDEKRCVPMNAEVKDLAAVICFSACADYLWARSVAKKFPPFKASKAEMSGILGKLTESQKISMFGMRALEKDFTLNDIFSSAPDGDYGDMCRDIIKGAPWIAGDILSIFSRKAFGVICVRILWDLVFAYDFYGKVVSVDVSSPDFEIRYAELAVEAFESGSNARWPGPTSTINASSNILFFQQLMFGMYRILNGLFPMSVSLSLTPGNTNNHIAIYPLQETLDPKTCSQAREFVFFAMKNGPAFLKQFQSFTSGLGLGAGPAGDEDED